MVCGNCGAENEVGRQFCSNCDTFLDWDAQESQPSTAPGATVATAPERPSAELAPVPMSAPPLTTRPTTQPTTQAPPPSHVAEPLVQGRQSPQRTETEVPQNEEQAPPDRLQCSRCGTVNPEFRRFCRHCGTWLVSPVVAVSSGRPARTWRQRLYDQWWGGPRGAYRRSLSRSVVAFRILACLLALGVVVALLTVADLRPIGRVQDYIGHVRGTGRVMDVTAADEPAAAVPDHPAAWVVDDVGGRGWATKWTASGGGDPDPACRNSELADPAAPGPAAGGLVLTLPAKVDVREIGIEAGLADGDDLQGSRWRPKTMELRWDDGSCQRIDLDKTADLQRFGVHAGAVGTVRLTVIAAYPPAVAGSDRLDVAEITFWQR